MSAFVWLAFSELIKGNVKSYIKYAIIAACFHVMALVIAPLGFVLVRKLPVKLLLIVIGVSVSLYIVNISQRLLGFMPPLALLEQKASFYLSDQFNNSYNLSVGCLFNLGLAIFLRIKKEKEYVNDTRICFSINCLLAAFCITCVVNAFSVFVERIVSVMNMSLAFICPIYAGFIRRSKYRYLAFLIFLVYCLMYFTKNIFTPDPSGLGMYEFYPFTYDFKLYFSK